MSSILVVCTGNVCRSPMAEGFLRDALERRLGTDAPAVRSAGTAGWDGSAAMQGSVQAARERGVDIGGHVARRLEPAMVEQADLLVCMAAEHREAIASWFPDAIGRTFTLKELARLLEHHAPVEGAAADPVARVAAADRARRSGFPGNPFDEDVVDPLGMPLDSYRAIAWELDEWCERVAEGLAGPVPVPVPREGS